MRRMKPETFWAIVDKDTGRLGQEGGYYREVRPLLYAKKRWATEILGDKGRVVKVVIRQAR